jgi:hypothetical protein
MDSDSDSASDAPRGRSALPRTATISGQPEGWFAYPAAYQAAQNAAREYAEQSFAGWSKSIAFAAQREADWFDQANRAFAAWYVWYAWWPAAYGMAPGVAPLAGGVSAWWWNSQNALPFAGVV